MYYFSQELHFSPSVIGIKNCVVVDKYSEVAFEIPPVLLVKLSKYVV